MKTTILKMTVGVLILAMSFSCDNKDELEIQSSLKGTNWKLIGIMDAETSILTELEPKDCDRCYTLTFDTDSTFSTFSSSNELEGIYMADYAKQSIRITEFGGTKIGEKGDGDLYAKPFWNMDIQSFSSERNELKFYYNENKSYLLFRRLEEVVNIDVTDQCGCECEDKTVIAVLKDEPAYVGKHCFDHVGRVDAFYFYFDNEKQNFDFYSYAGIFPCGEIPEQYQKEGQLVYISGNVVSDIVLAGCIEPNIKLAHMHLFELESIKINTD